MENRPGGSLKVWHDAIATLASDEVLDLNGVMTTAGLASTPEHPLPALEPSGAPFSVAVSSVDVVCSGSSAQVVVTSFLSNSIEYKGYPIEVPWWTLAALPGTTQQMATAPFDKTALFPLPLDPGVGGWAGVRLSWPAMDGSAQPTAVDMLRVDGFVMAHGEFGVTAVPSYGKGSFKRRYALRLSQSEIAAHLIYNRT